MSIYRTGEQSQESQQERFNRETFDFVLTAAKAKKYAGNKVAWRRNIKKFVEREMKRKHGAASLPRVKVWAFDRLNEAVSVSVEGFATASHLLEITELEAEG